MNIIYCKLCNYIKHTLNVSEVCLKCNGEMYLIGFVEGDE